jgi:hypothetical protein
VEKEGWEDSEEQPGECVPRCALGGLAGVHGGGRGEDQVRDGSFFQERKKLGCVAVWQDSPGSSGIALSQRREFQSKVAGRHPLRSQEKAGRIDRRAQASPRHTATGHA